MAFCLATYECAVSASCIIQTGYRIIADAET